MTASVCGVPCSKFQRQVINSDHGSHGWTANLGLVCCQKWPKITLPRQRCPKKISSSTDQLFAQLFAKLPAVAVMAAALMFCCNDWCGSVHDTRPSLGRMAPQQHLSFCISCYRLTLLHICHGLTSAQWKQTTMAVQFNLSLLKQLARQCGVAASSDGEADWLRWLTKACCIILPPH